MKHLVAVHIVVKGQGVLGNLYSLVKNENHRIYIYTSEETWNIKGHYSAVLSDDDMVEESSWCMCSHPHESVIHIIHLCLLHTRSPSPGKCYQLVELVRFLKKNPQAFEWPGAVLEQTDGGEYSERQRGGYRHAYEPLSLSQVTCWVRWWELTPHPCHVQGRHSDRTIIQVCMLPSSFIGGCSSPGQGGMIPISLTFVCFSSDLVGIYWLDCTCT